MEIRRILVLTDFSESGTAAEQTGTYLAATLNCQITFTHTIDCPAGWDHLNFGGDHTFLKNPSALGDQFPELKTAIQNAAKHFTELEKTTRDKGVKCDTELLFDRSFEDVEELTNRENAQLLVLGMAGKGNKRFGSSAQTVLRRTKVPVIFVREIPVTRLENFYIATDYKDAERLKPALHKLKALAEKLDLTPEMLYVNTPLDFKNTEELESLKTNFLNKTELHNVKTAEINDYHVYEGISKYRENQKQTSLCAVINKKQSGLNYFLHDSKTEELLQKFIKPVLVIKESESYNSAL